MKLQFDANQQFQIDAVSTLTDLFDGQPRGMAEFSVIDLGKAGAEAGMFAGQQQTELGVGNQLLIDDDRLRDNTRKVQDRNDIELLDPKAPLEAWDLFDGPINRSRKCPHFSVEMETGTGKTYVYLRTIFELHRRYGFSKYVIVVPSVAIREGVLKNLEITAEHFKAIYSQEAEHFVYDAKRVNRLRQFATSTTPQILVINIDAFRKNFTGTEAEQKSNVIYKESDKLSAHDADLREGEAVRPGRRRELPADGGHSRPGRGTGKGHGHVRPRRDRGQANSDMGRRRPPAKMPAVGMGIGRTRCDSE